jgi:hypothetical protein
MFKTMLLGLLGLLLIGSVSDAMGAERSRNSCRRADRLRIQDLDMSPDPIVEGQRIRSWKVKVQFEGNRECDTEIEIREGNDVVARERTTLRPGVNEVSVRPDERYNFRGREHCFDVVVDLDGNRNRADADRRFCARQRPGWSMREPGDRSWGDRPGSGGYR